MKWADFDAGGFPRGFYAEDIHGPLMLPIYGPVPAPSEEVPDPVPPVVGEEPNPAIPPGVVVVSEAQWLDFVAHPGRRRWVAGTVESYEPPPAPAPGPPDNPTLSDWRCGLTLWKRPDGTPRIDEVTAKVADLVASGHPLGRIARERLEYSNHVLRDQLVQLSGLFGFTEAEIDESLHRAERVRLYDLSGVWPLP